MVLFLHIFFIICGETLTSLLMVNKINTSVVSYYYKISRSSNKFSHWLFADDFLFFFFSFFNE